MSNKYIGQGVTRLDARDKAMGRIRYTDDSGLSDGSFIVTVDQHSCADINSHPDY